MYEIEEKPVPLEKQTLRIGTLNLTGRSQSPLLLALLTLLTFHRGVSGLSDLFTALHV
jgi:hypothetical protein